MVISYTWASNLVYKVTGEEAPAQLQRGDPGPQQGQQGASAAAPPLEGLEALVSRAGRQVEGWRSITVR